MAAVDPTFEFQHPRAGDGQFTQKRNSPPSASLSLAPYEVEVTPYAGEAIAGRGSLDAELFEDSMVIGAESQVGGVTGFVEEHRLEDGRYLTSVNYVYLAQVAGGRDDEFAVVTETEQFVADEPGEYARTAGRQREGSSWSVHESDLVVCSIERGNTMVRRAAEDALLHQAYFTSTVPWAGTPLAQTEDAFRDASARLRGEL